MKRTCVASLAVCLAVMTDTAHAALIVNGGFENHKYFVGNAEHVMSLWPGADPMRGWTVVSSGLAWIGPRAPFLHSASKGKYYLDLTGYDNAAPHGGVTQTIATIPDKRYVLRFDMGSSADAGVPNSIRASAGSTSRVFLTTGVGINQWERQVLEFVATGPTTEITLLADMATWHYAGLDNVSVKRAIKSSSGLSPGGVSSAPVPVPEPSSLAVMIAAFAGLRLRRFYGDRRSLASWSR